MKEGDTNQRLRLSCWILGCCQPSAQGIVGRQQRLGRVSGTSKCTRLFGGAANLDEFNFPAKDFSGLTLRLLDPAPQEWWLYWVNSSDGLLEPPVHGRFRNGAGFSTAMTHIRARM